MSNINSYEINDHFYHCSKNSQLPCDRSASANIYIPWTASNAAAIMRSIDVLFNIFQSTLFLGKNMKQNILLDVSNKANLIQTDFYFVRVTPPN